MRIIYFFLAVFLFPSIAAAQITVSTKEIKPVNRQEILSLSGRAVPSNKIDITAKAEGIVQGLKLKEGDPVKKGTTLMRFVKNDALIKLNEARNGMTVAALNILARQEELRRNYAQLKSAQARLDLTKSEYERELKLLEKGFSSDTTVKRLKSDFDAAEAAYQVLAISLEGVTENEVLPNSAFEDNKDNLRNVELNTNFVNSYLPLELAKASFISAQNNFDSAQLSYFYTRPQAEIDGVVVSVPITEGQSIKKGDLLMTISDNRNYEALLYVNERNINSIKEGAKVAVTVDVLKGKKFTGQVSKISTSPSRESLTYEITTKLNNSKGIQDGMTLRAEIVLNELRNVLMVPLDSVNEKFEGTFVYIVENGKAFIRKVKTGARIGEEVQITEGINFGDKLITKGWQFVKDKDPVIVK